MLPKKKILGVGITDALKKEILEYVIENLGKTGKSWYVVTPNPEILVFSNHQKPFQNILNSANLALNDGVGLSIAGKILGITLKERFTGVDFMEMLCSEVSNRPITVGFLGGRDRVAESAAECLLSKYPNLRVVFTGSEWNQGLLKSPKPANKRRSTNSSDESASRGPLVDVLFVAFGFPKQEEWMAQHQNSNIYKVAVGVGGAFDYISGKVPRAPIFVRKLGLEWLFRLVVQPWRFKRQLALVEFIGLVVKEKLFS